MIPIAGTVRGGAEQDAVLPVRWWRDRAATDAIRAHDRESGGRLAILLGGEEEGGEDLKNFKKVKIIQKKSSVLYVNDYLRVEKGMY